MTTFNIKIEVSANFDETVTVTLKPDHVELEELVSASTVFDNITEANANKEQFASDNRESMFNAIPEDLRTNFEL